MLLNKGYRLQGLVKELKRKKFYNKHVSRNAVFKKMPYFIF